MKNVLALISVVGIAVASLTTTHAQTLDESAALLRLKEHRATNIDPGKDGRWVQPNNLTEKCEVFMWGAGEPPAEIKWLGSCQQGRASGIGLVMTTDSARGYSSVGLEEYGSSANVPVTYRQVGISPQGKVIIKGRVTPDIRIASVTSVYQTPLGSSSVLLVQERCTKGECIRRTVDPITGSMNYSLQGFSGYNLMWNDARAENNALLNYRVLFMDGAILAKKVILDGSVYDLYHDPLSGRIERVVFSDTMNSILAMPIEQYAIINNDVMSAVATSDAKFASVYPRICRDQEDPLIRALCDPSELLPSEGSLAGARAELNDAARSSYQTFQRNAAASQSQSAQVAQAPSQQMQQQAIAAEQQRQASQEALRRSFETLSQAGQAAQQAGQQMMQSYGVPQVQAAVLNQTGIFHCRTIGYITTCN